MVRTLFTSLLACTLFLALQAAATVVDPITEDLSLDYDSLPSDFQDAVSHQTASLQRSDDYGSGAGSSSPLEKRMKLGARGLICGLLGTCNTGSGSKATTTTAATAATPYYTTISTVTNFALYSNNICHIGDLGYGVFTSESTCRQACANRDDCASYTYFGTTCSLSSRAAMSYISAYIGAFCGIKDSTCSSYNGGWLLTSYCSNVQWTEKTTKLVTPSQAAKRLRRRGLDAHRRAAAEHTPAVTCRNRETACLIDEDEDMYACRNLLTSIDSCGSCGNDCTKSHGSSATCVRGVCLTSGGDL